MDLKEHIKELAVKHLKDESHFLVEVVINTSKEPKKVLVLLDGDNGVNIDDCAQLSRAIGNELEEENLMDDAFRLEVSSPGVDFPLQSVRQYRKNIDRMVKVTLQDGEDVKGVLKGVDEKKIILDQEVKAGKKVEYKEVGIPMTEIKKTIVQISFK